MCPVSFVARNLEPAKALGMTSVWIDRREGRGGGASIDVEARPDATFTSMAAFAAEAVPA